MHPKVLQRLSSQKLLLKTLNGQYSTSQANKNLIHSQYEDVFIPVENVADFCLSKFEPYSKLPALTCAASGKEFSYEMVKDLAKRFGSQLLVNNLKPGNKIAVVVPNCPEFGPVLFGSMGVGVTVIPISPMLTPLEISGLFCISEPKLVVTCDALIPLVQEALKEQIQKLPIVTISDNSNTDAIPFGQFTANDGSQQLPRLEMHEDKCC